MIQAAAIQAIVPALRRLILPAHLRQDRLVHLHRVALPVDHLADRKTLKMPNGCILHKGGRVRMARERIWEIPEEIVKHFNLQLDDDAFSFDSEVVVWPNN